MVRVIRDFVVLRGSLPGGATWAFEVKRSLAPSLTKGFHLACADLEPERRIVVYPGEERFPLGQDVEVLPVRDAARALLG